jgi:hypothetical protein
MLDKVLREFPADRSYLPAKAADTRLMCIFLYDLEDRFFTKRRGIVREAVFPDQSRHQEVGRYLHLLLFRIAGKMDNFHTVPERPQDIVGNIRRDDEHDPRKVEAGQDTVV